MKKKPVILILIGLLAVVGAAWVFMRPAAGIVIQGDIKPEDVAAIKSLVKVEMRKRLWPKFSWVTIRRFPGNVRWYFKHNVQDITLIGAGRTYVTISGPHDTDMSLPDIYEVIKGTNGWKVGRTATILENYDFEKPVNSIRAR